MRKRSLFASSPLSRRNTHTSSGDLSQPAWHTTDHVSCSSEGANGVLFVRTAAGSFVIKGSQQVAEETFASCLFKALAVPTPRVRLTSYTQSEWGTIKSTLRRQCGSIAEVNGLNVQILCKVEKELDRPVLLIMEMVPGASMLEGMLPNQAQFLFNADQAAGQRRLQQVGRIMAVDLLVNNADRFPAQGRSQS